MPQRSRRRRRSYHHGDLRNALVEAALGILRTEGTAGLQLRAIARSAGWISQWLEMMTDDAQRIGRPQQLYIGAAKRDYVALSDRT